ncbi:MAG: helix-turn-helix domain-containing protein [Dehalococcoidia bacterium]|nr:helix-turn-helix domain-containing protein [Dehalococcoidia bacterium]
MASSQLQTQWLPLSEACALMKVHQSTLRQWADNGQIRTFRTAGGHRRFLREDLVAMTQGRRPVQIAVATLEESALRRIRKGLHGEHSPRKQAWMGKLSEEGRVKMRVLGRRLLDLSITYVSQRRGQADVLSEVGVLAEGYGQDIARVGVPLGQVLEAFIFFRNSLFEAVREAAQHGSLRGTDTTLIWEQMEQVADHMLLSMIRSYEGSHNGAGNDTQSAIQAAGAV